MQQFVVPQFIDVEDKIIGPVTTRQFLIMLIGSFFIFVAYKLFSLYVFGAVALIIIIIIAVFAWGKVAGQMFHLFLLNFIQTMLRPRIRIWNKTLSHKELDYLRKRGIIKDEEIQEQRKAPKRRHIRDLSLIVNTGGFYRPDEEDMVN